MRVCFGLPHAEWESEENLFISLYQFKKLTDPEHWDILDRLGEIQAAPFLLKIHSINYTPRKNNTGIIWAAIESTPSFEALKKNIYKQLDPLHQNTENFLSYSQAIRLGTLQKESGEKMALYFEANGEFSSSNFKVSEFSIAQLHQTPKRSFYTVEKRYPLND